jgi:hypothetical protein
MSHHPQNKYERFLVSVNKSQKRVSSFYSLSFKLQNPDYVKKVARKYRNVTKKCSASCCGNPRKFFNEKTLQEKKNNVEIIFQCFSD